MDTRRCILTERYQLTIVHNAIPSSSVHQSISFQSSGKQRYLRAQSSYARKYGEMVGAEKACVENYLGLLLKENERYNLTGIKTFDACVEQIVDDSASLIPLIDSNLAIKDDEPLCVIDVGSGAGVPGLIFAIQRPNWQVVCVDASAKKAAFIKNAISQCRSAFMAFSAVVRSRVEDLGADSRYRESFDVAVSRGVAELRTICEYCIPFLKQGGLFLAPKGPEITDEVAAAQSALQLLGGSLIEVTNVDSFGSLGQRTAILIKKTNTTPIEYPRKSGTPSKRPL